MKRIIAGKTILILLIIIASACVSSDNPLKDVKNFKPDDKYFTASLNNMHFILETSEIERVDQEFAKLIKSYGLPISAEGCADGTFIGESPYDAYDYKHIVKLTIKNQKIIDVDYDEINYDGIGKQNNKEYCEEMSVSGTTPAIAYPVYENGLMEKQNMLKVDAVTGATYSLYRFRYAVTVALMKARLEYVNNLK